MGNPVFAGRYELRRDKGACVEQVVFDPAVTSSGHLGFAEQFASFVDTILQDAPNVCSFEDALQVHRTMSAIDQSLATGQIIDLSPSI
jgi:predicted dehydrogenase